MLYRVLNTPHDHSVYTSLTRMTKIQLFLLFIHHQNQSPNFKEKKWSRWTFQSLCLWAVISHVIHCKLSDLLKPGFQISKTYYPKQQQFAAIWLISRLKTGLIFQAVITSKSFCICVHFAFCICEKQIRLQEVVVLSRLEWQNTFTLGSREGRRRDWQMF